MLPEDILNYLFGFKYSEHMVKKTGEMIFEYLGNFFEDGNKKYNNNNNNNNINNDNNNLNLTNNQKKFTKKSLDNMALSSGSINNNFYQKDAQITKNNFDLDWPCQRLTAFDDSKKYFTNHQTINNLSNYNEENVNIDNNGAINIAKGNYLKDNDELDTFNGNNEMNNSSFLFDYIDFYFLKQTCKRFHSILWKKSYYPKDFNLNRISYIMVNAMNGLHVNILTWILSTNMKNTGPLSIDEHQQQNLSHRPIIALEKKKEFIVKFYSFMPLILNHNEKVEATSKGNYSPIDIIKWAYENEIIEKKDKDVK